MRSHAKIVLFFKRLGLDVTQLETERSGKGTEFH
jgi:hypothetical protein